MVRNRTVFILGAGASHEVNMPTGEMLKKTISNYLKYEFDEWNERLPNGDKLIYNALYQYQSGRQQKTFSLKDLLNACHHISEAMPQVRSIDSFIELHNDNKAIEFVGKLAIVRSILESERSSALWINKQDGIRNIPFDNLTKTWYTPFLHILTEDCQLKLLPQRLELLTIIDFNYDRCFEHYLFHAFQNLYNVSETVAAELIEAIDIFHPYGSVGRLPWKRGENNPIEYGETPNYNSLLNLSSQIKTYTERKNAADDAIQKIRLRLIEARFIIFLGFAFHRQNMELLKPEEKMQSHPRPIYFATAHKNSANNIRLIKSDIENLLQTDAGGSYVEDMTCAQLLKEHSRYLSLSFRG